MSRKAKEVNPINALPKSSLEQVDQWAFVDDLPNAEVIEKIATCYGIVMNYNAFCVWKARRKHARFISDSSVSVADRLNALCGMITDATYEIQKSNGAKSMETLLYVAKIVEILKRAEQGDLKIEQSKRDYALNVKDYALREKKFMRDTTELFMRWIGDEKIKAIADSSDTNEAKIEALGRALFPNQWQDLKMLNA